MNFIARAGVFAAAIAATVAFSQTTASAAEVLPQPTPESITAMQAELEGQGIVPTASVENGVLKKDYDVSQPGSPRVVIETTEPAPVPPGTIAPRLRAGVGNGVYIYLDRADQNAVVVGGAAGLAILICGLPAVGQVACAGVSAALAGAAAYVSTNGFCPNELEINYLSFPNPAPRFKCV